MVKTQNKFTSRYKKALIDSVVQALDNYSTKFTKNDIRLEVEAERFTVIGDTLILTSYRPMPRFRLENQPVEELLVHRNTPTGMGMEVEGETELIG
ncbi:MAG: hypothetical protein AMQ22_02245 [Candidatus Methanofastidiosum methylothiophilum]|uniref:Uncharacterized protein n=1 Tax=Candidatus Methanofastidiosum methylothiophilum TaxID=1705564 RepID=A0A150IJ78_9EURY|nr:MAG: hypothetical protein AMQ22_02245 [Candidatus Methanofastidiosum methylthiophilus]